MVGVEINMVINNTNLPIALPSDERSNFISEVLKQVADILGILLEHDETSRDDWNSWNNDCISWAGADMSTFISKITSRPNARALGVSLAECST